MCKLEEGQGAASSTKYGECIPAGHCAHGQVGPVPRTASQHNPQSSGSCHSQSSWRLASLLGSCQDLQGTAGHQHRHQVHVKARSTVCLRYTLAPISGLTVQNELPWLHKTACCTSCNTTSPINCSTWLYHDDAQLPCTYCDGKLYWEAWQLTGIPASEGCCSPLPALSTCKSFPSGLLCPLDIRPGCCMGNAWLQPTSAPLGSWRSAEACS